MKRIAYFLVVVMMVFSSCATTIVKVPPGQAKKETKVPPGQMKKATGSKSAKQYAPGQQKKSSKGKGKS